jgi:hypothetical protein
MEAQKVIKQILLQKVSSDREEAEKYYSILSAVNSLGLTKSEIQLVAFTAIKGNITYANVRAEFCSVYNTTSPTINNIVSKLKKQNIFLKTGKLIYVNPVIALDFKKNVTLEINMEHEAS